MTLAFIRGQYLNNFELQSYYPMLKNKDIKIIGFSSLKPKHKVLIPTIKLFSPLDLPNFPYKLPILNRLYSDAMYLYGLEKKLKGFDIAHVRETYFNFSSQAIKAKQRSFIKKVLVTCSETISFNHETIRGRKKLKQFVLKNADHFHTLTQKAKNCLIKEGVEENKITVIPYGINLDKFKFEKRKPNKKIQILFIGRLEEQKGIKELLEAWQILKSNYQNIELKLIGKGPLENLIIKNNLKTIFYPYSQIPQIMCQADILVLPSKPTKFWEEYFGMVLLEAMACGLPIVTTDCGAIPEVVNNASKIVNHSDSRQLYKALKLFIDKPNIRKKYSQLGLERVKKNFDAKIQSQKLYNLYKSL